MSGREGKPSRHPTARIVAVGQRLVAGVDEAGRGPLAGPLAVAAVILDQARPIDGLDDSKKLSPARRETLYAHIVASARAWSVVLVEVGSHPDRHRREGQA